MDKETQIKKLKKFIKEYQYQLHNIAYSGCEPADYRMCCIGCRECEGNPCASDCSLKMILREKVNG